MPLIWNNQAALDARYPTRPLAAGGNIGGTFGALNNKLFYTPPGFVTVAVGPNNTGSGAAAIKNGICGDAFGCLLITTGSTATPGSLATVTYSTPMTGGSQYYIFLQMYDHPTAQPYPLNMGLNSFDIALNTIATGTTYTVAYHVVESF